MMVFAATVTSTSADFTVIEFNILAVGNGLIDGFKFISTRANVFISKTFNEYALIDLFLKELAVNFW